MKLSIIIPTFQRPSLLKQCLDSVSSQIDSNVRVVVVDQSFNDDTRMVCNQYSLVEYLHVDYQNKSKAVNEGIAYTTEEVISTIDDDTILNNNWVSIIFQTFRDPKIDIVQGSICVTDNSSLDSVANNQDIIIQRRIIGRSNIPPLFKIGCNFAFRRQVFQRVGLFNESFGPGSTYKAGMDLEWGYRVFKNGYKLLLNPELGLSHISWRKREDLRKQTIDYGNAFGKFLKNIRKENYIDFCAYYFRYLMVGHLMSCQNDSRRIWYESALKSYSE